jgi:hypothetical protein
MRRVTRKIRHKTNRSKNGTNLKEKMEEGNRPWPTYYNNRQLIGEEDTLLWLSRGELKVKQ